MRRIRLFAIIFVLGLTLLSCGYPDCELPTRHTTEILCVEEPPLTTVSTTLAGGIDCPGVPTETVDMQPTCNTGSLIEPTPIRFISPEDETKASVTYGMATSDGLSLEATLHGYKSESIGENLYFKSNEPIEMTITVKNETDSPIYQWLPTMCHDITPSHDHELQISLKNKNGNKLVNMNRLAFPECAEAIEIWCLSPGESYEWKIKFIAGKIKETVVWKDPILDSEFFTHIEYYDDSNYPDGSCIFEGTVEFPFMYVADDNINAHKLSLPLSVKVFHITN